MRIERAEDSIVCAECEEKALALISTANAGLSLCITHLNRLQKQITRALNFEFRDELADIERG